MPLSGSYYYPQVQKPVSAELLRSTSVSEYVTLTSGSAATVLSASEVANWSNLALSINNAGAGALGTISVDFSPDNVNWEQWDTAVFSGLSAGIMLSLQIAGNSRRYIRVLSTDTPAGTSVTASLNVNTG